MAALRKELGRVRQLGYAVCDEEDEIGVRCVGAPILNRHGHSIAAISVAGTTQQIPPERVAELGQAVKDAAAEISARFQRAAEGKQIRRFRGFTGCVQVPLSSRVRRVPSGYFGFAGYVRFARFASRLSRVIE